MKVQKIAVFMVLCGIWGSAKGAEQDSFGKFATNLNISNMSFTATHAALGYKGIVSHDNYAYQALGVLMLQGMLDRYKDNIDARCSGLTNKVQFGISALWTGRNIYRLYALQAQNQTIQAQPASNFVPAANPQYQDPSNR